MISVREIQPLRPRSLLSDKLDFARDYLPADLTPSGAPNPIGTLYELINDGLHQRTEEECVAICDRCRSAFEYVVKKLREAKREDEAYVESIRKAQSTARIASDLDQFQSAAWKEITCCGRMQFSTS